MAVRKADYLSLELVGQDKQQDSLPKANTMSALGLALTP